jgi:pimeloyl-ACP methyl ester carboxylesterase
MTNTRTRRRIRAGFGALVTSTALVAALLALAPAPAAQGRSSTTAASAGAITLAKGPSHVPAGRAKPTVVLVHGAFADASSWRATIQKLGRLGYPVIAPSNPLRGLTSDADYIRSVLATIPGPVVLVGHSYGGAVITNAARRADNVKALVYVAAFIPDEGQNLQTAYSATDYPGSLLGPATTQVRPAPNAAAPGGQDLDIYIQAAHFREVFAGDQSVKTALTMALTQRPLSLTANSEGSGPPAWKTLPSWSLISLDDKAIDPGGQRFMAQRAHAHIAAVHSAHDVMVSHPGAVVRVIEAAAVAVR